MVSVMAVKIQLSSPRGVRLSLSLPGILQQHNTTQMEVCQRRQTVLHVAQLTHRQRLRRVDVAHCDWRCLESQVCSDFCKCNIRRLGPQFTEGVRVALTGRPEFSDVHLRWSTHNPELWQNITAFCWKILNNNTSIFRKESTVIFCRSHNRHYVPPCFLDLHFLVYFREQLGINTVVVPNDLAVDPALHNKAAHLQCDTISRQ